MASPRSGRSAVARSLSHPVSMVGDMEHELRIDEERLAEMLMAVELDVDRDEFSFRSPSERAMWDELEAEFQERLAREGRSWVPLEAA